MSFLFSVPELSNPSPSGFASLGPEHRPSRGISRTSPAPTIPAHPLQHGSTGQDHGLLQVLQEAPWTSTNLKDVGILELAVLNAFTPKASSETFADLSRPLRRLGLLPVCNHDILHNIPSFSSPATVAAADIILGPCSSEITHDLRVLRAEPHANRIFHSEDRDSYIQDQNGDQHDQAEETVREITYDFLADPPNGDAVDSLSTGVRIPCSVSHV